MDLFKRTRELIFRSKQHLVLGAIILLTFYSCSSTKFVPEGKYLLDNYRVNMNKGDINEEEFLSYVKPKPNKRILGFIKFHLSLYNLSKKDNNNGFNRWLRSIGEEPVLYDKFQVDKTRSQLQLYLRYKGYYEAKVTDTVIIKKAKVKVVYNVDAKIPSRIGNINYLFEDTTVARYILRDTTKSLLVKGELFDVDIIARERERIENLIKSQGYFKFSKEEYVSFEADSTKNSKIIDVKLIIKKFNEIPSIETTDKFPHPRYKIRNVYINTNYKSQESLSNSQAYLSTLDTLDKDDFKIIYSKSPNIKPGIIVASTFLIPGEYYNQENVNLTYRHLSSLEVFRLVNIEFIEPEGQEGKRERVLDCSIQLTPFYSQSITVEPEVTNSSGNIGGGGNLIFQHRNLFMGAENFDFRLKGGIETMKKTEYYYFGNLIELGAETTLKIPKFLLPFRTDQFIKKFNPKTSLNLAYNLQRRPDYTRTIANASFGYTWKGNRNLTHMIKPIEINLVRIPVMSKDFSDWIRNKYIAYSYQSHMVPVSNYNVIFSNQNIQSTRDFVYIRYNAESAGNILYNIYRLGGVSSDSGVYKIFNTAFAQYIRSDVDFRYYNVVDKNTSLVYRIFAGVGLPYKNSKALPFEKKYFSGGANSIRAWQVRNLGPGSDTLNPGPYPNKTGDIKLEANIEYRFKLFWLLRGAIFLDAGNIWAIKIKDEKEEAALFKFNKLYNDLAIGTGFGTRFDFSFFIFRLDLGIKLKYPKVPVLSTNNTNPKKPVTWTIARPHGFERGDFVLNFGIGYPF